MSLLWRCLVELVHSTSTHSPLSRVQPLNSALLAMCSYVNWGPLLARDPGATGAFIIFLPWIYTYSPWCLSTSSTLTHYNMENGNSQDIHHKAGKRNMRRGLARLSRLWQGGKAEGRGALGIPSWNSEHTSLQKDHCTWWSGCTDLKYSSLDILLTALKNLVGW